MVEVDTITTDQDSPSYLLQQLRLSILSCSTCGDTSEKVVKKTGEVKITPLVKIPAKATSVVDSSEAPVPGSGSLTPRYLFIGEAPGENEDIEGEPFIGVSGKYLKRKLITQLAGIKLRDCRFTNIIKCHPLDNRDPYASEIKACWPWLQSEIALIKPEVIFTVGRIATKQILGKSLAESHGQVFEWNGYPVMPLYHPAGVNRAVNRKKLEVDYKNIRKKLAENLTDGKLNRPANAKTILVDSPARLTTLLEHLSKVDQFALDIETDEEEWTRNKGKKKSEGGVPDPITNVLVGIAVAIEGSEEGESATAYYIPTSKHPDHKPNLEPFGIPNLQLYRGFICAVLQPHVERCRVYMHNAKFEMESLEKYGMEFKRPFCTMVAAYLSGEETLGLKDIIRRNYSVTMNELTEFINMQKQVVSEAPLSSVFPYGCADAEFTLKYGLRERKAIEERGQNRLFYDIMMSLLPWIVREELDGLEIDEDKRVELEPYWAGVLAEVEDEIRELADNDDFNIRSPEQVAEVLFDDLDLPPTKLTKSGKHFSTDKGSLEPMKKVHPIIEPLLLSKSYQTIKSTFVDGPPKKLHPETMRLHAQVNQTGTDTTRFSYNDPNWQNLPVRTKESRRIREIIVPDSVGSVIVAIDQSQIELRYAAHLSQDVRMLAVFRENQSIHEETCRGVYKLEPDDEGWFEAYKDSKNGNFATLFGATKYKLSETFGSTIEVAEEFEKEHHRLYPEYWAWVKETKKKSKRLGYTETMWGYRRYLPDLSSSNRVLRSHAERIAVNTPIQGSAQHHIQYAMTLIWKEMQKRSMGARMIIQVHDELVFSVPEEEVGELVEMTSTILSTAVDLSIPTPVDVEVGQSWGELEAWESVEDQYRLVEG